MSARDQRRIEPRSRRRLLLLLVVVNGTFRVAFQTLFGIGKFRIGATALQGSG